jgi:hypothetical protein
MTLSKDERAHGPMPVVVSVRHPATLARRIFSAALEGAYVSGRPGSHPVFLVSEVKPPGGPR